MDPSIIESVLSWLQTSTTLGGLSVSLETLPADQKNAVMLSTLIGDAYIKRYKSGGHVAAYPFAVYLRSYGADTASRIDAMKALGDLSASIDDRGAWPVAPEGYQYVSLEIRTTPVLVAVGETGDPEDYQATFTLTYRKRG